MAGRGPAPKPKGQRRRTNADPIATTVLPAGGYTGASPDLPGDVEWHPETERWYDTWRTAPQAAAFLATDWQRLALLARLVERFVWSDKATEAKTLLSEIRLNEASLGALVADRLRLRMSLGEPEVGTGSVRTATRSGRDVERRQRALRAVAD